MILAALAIAAEDIFVGNGVWVMYCCGLIWLAKPNRGYVLKATQTCQEAWRVFPCENIFTPPLILNQSSLPS
jgi:hypothetical protein